jgi:hypothetical protein
MNELGPVVLNLGSMRQTSIGRWTIGVSIALGVVALAITSLAVFAMVAGFTFAYLILLGIVGLLVVVAGAAIVVFSIVMIMQVTGTTAWIHADGLQLGQSWFRRRQILWSNVVRIEPPTANSTWIRCDLVLRSGERNCADRLRLKPVVGATGHYVNHPDVQAVLDHFAGWQQSHGGAWQH